MNSKRDSQQKEKEVHGMGKIFANPVSDKGLISRICKKYIQLNSKKKKKKNLIFKMVKGPEQTVFQRKDTNGQ